jgi:hypothetical protein
MTPRARRKKDSSDAPRSLGSRQNGEVAGGGRMIDMRARHRSARSGIAHNHADGTFEME